MQKSKIKNQNNNLKFKIINLSFFIGLGILTGSNLFLLINRYWAIKKKKQTLKQELQFWKKVASQHPEYPDGWAKLAVIWYNLRQRKLARLAIEKARKLDPVREELKSLEEKMKK